MNNLNEEKLERITHDMVLCISDYVREKLLAMKQQGNFDSLSEQQVSTLLTVAPGAVTAGYQKHKDSFLKRIKAI